MPSRNMTLSMTCGGGGGRLPAALHHAAAAALDGKLYVVGGYRDLWPWKPMATVWRYDPGVDRWEPRRAVPPPRGGVAVAVVSGKLYAVGGKDGQVFTTNEEYAPVADSWRSRAPMPTGRDHL